MSVRSRLSLAGALAVLLCTGALQPVFATGAWLPRTVGAVAVVTLASAGSRALRLPHALQPVLGLVALLGYLVLAFAAGTLGAGLLPGSGTAAAFSRLVADAGADVAQYGPPAPATDALVLLVTGGVGLVAVLVDALASAARRPALAGLPLLALFAVPSAVVPSGVGWLAFVLAAAGWLALLLVEGREQALRWGTPLRTGGDLAGVGRAGRRIGGVALGVAVLVPVVVPGLDGRLLGGGEGGGLGAGGSRSVTTYNPLTRLRGELTRPRPVEVLRYTTDDPEPDYLRMTTLSVYDGAGWRQQVLRGNLREDGVDEPLPAPVGRTGAVPSRVVSSQVQIATLKAFWLPVPATPNRVEIAGPWMWDPSSESVFTTRSDTAEVDAYTVRSSRVLPGQQELNAGDGVLPAEIAPYATPVEATEAVRARTERIVAGARTAYERASALQAFFRDPGNGFSYSEQVPAESSPDALEDFLTQRQGFCQQYASAMGAMLRLAGVPSRVAIGFTAGTRQTDGRYLVTTDQAHAWPEAWFAGAGWVRFEPTPSQDGIRPPFYAAPAPVGPSGPGAAAPAPAPEAGGALEGSEATSERRDRLTEEPVTPAAGAEDGSAPDDLPRRELALGAGALLLLATPALVHALRRRARWRRPTAAAAWEQLREDATDSGYDWRSAQTPRVTADRLVQEVGLRAPAAAAVARLTEAVERERYARPSAALASGSAGTAASGHAVPRGGVALAERPVPPEPGGDAGADLARDSAAVRRALRGRMSRAQRLRSSMFPRSTLRRASAVLGDRTADLAAACDNALDRLAQLRRRRQ